MKKILILALLTFGAGLAHSSECDLEVSITPLIAYGKTFKEANPIAMSWELSVNGRQLDSALVSNIPCNETSYVGWYVSGEGFTHIEISYYVNGTLFKTLKPRRLVGTLIGTGFERDVYHARPRGFNADVNQIQL